VVLPTTTPSPRHPTPTHLAALCCFGGWGEVDDFQDLGREEGSRMLSKVGATAVPHIPLLGTCLLFQGHQGNPSSTLWAAKEEVSPKY
jgi:hypothetical protein